MTRTYQFQQSGKRFKVCSHNECGAPAAWETTEDARCEKHMNDEWKAPTIKECDSEGCKKLPKWMKRKWW